MSGLELKFKRGRFELENADQDRQAMRSIAGNPYWLKEDDIYVTNSLKAAAVFRSIASPKAERIFKRAFQEFYDLPRRLRLPDQLDPHQIGGVTWQLTRKRSYLAHAPGAGKTIEAIVAAFLAAGPGQILFIVPPTLTLNWEKEIKKVSKWFGFKTMHASIVPASLDQFGMYWDAPVIICPDSMLTKDWVYTKLNAMKKRFIVVDEASRFKEALSSRSIAFYGGEVKGIKYPGLFQNARHVVFLDGSPMPNRPMELWAPTYALSPETIDCMSQDDFGYRYCGPKITKRGQYTFLHSSHEAELKARMQKDFMHVVTEEELSHPERLRSMVFMSEDVRSGEQKTWERKHLSQLVASAVSEDRSQGQMAHFRAELGMRKVPWIARYVGERLKRKNESILLFAWHRDVITALAEELAEFKPGVVMGGTDAKTRERVFEWFQSGKTKIIIGNISAMGRGHNLQKANRVIFGEFSWTDELNRQCEKRASRRGSENASVRCEYIVAPGSMDEPVLNSVFTKEKRTKRIIG